ncbi:MAG: hypothetical protein PUD95_08685 [Succinatimonas sp.]|nr:hypothetical protein [Succinatimonas sp.]MDY6246271.1 hypothetical protein [Succinivibrio sp.]MDY6261260.1 hypothetical protein [Succinivibrio sp.]
MNKKLLLSLGIASAVSLSGCSILSSMLTTEDEYLDKASAAMDIDSKDLTVLQETIRPGLNGLSYDLKGKDGTLYRCNLKSGMTGATGAASCKKKVGNKWEPIGEQQAESDDDGSWFHFTTGMAKSEYEPEDPYTRGVGAKSRGSKRVATSGKATIVADDSAPISREYVGGTSSSETPTIVFTPKDDESAFKTNPTKTYNGRFKVRDEQGHSYECHFANVGQVVSDTIAVCTKLY